MGDSVFVNGLAVVHKGSEGKSAAAFPDVCLCPPAPPVGPIPVPLVNTAAAADLAGGAQSVLTEGNPTGKKSSYIARSTGDEAARSTGGGIATHVVQGKAYFVSYSMDVLIEGENVPRHLDLMTHNHGSPTPNTGPWPWASSADKSASGGKDKAAQKGAIKVKVVNKHDGSPVEGATIVVAHKKGTTDAGGEATIDKLRPGREWVTARKAWPSEDHFIFVSHYPKTSISRKAESEASAIVEVSAGATAEARLEIEVYRPLVKVVLYRNHIHLAGGDKYGHWWTVIDDTESYGWWPKYGLGDEATAKGSPPEPPDELPTDAGAAAKVQHVFESALHTVRKAMHDLWDNSLTRTFRGVEGDLNGVKSFGGWLRRNGDPCDMDPHHIYGDQGKVRYQPVLHDARKDEDLKTAMPAFALAYTGSWSWRFEFGNHCHTFQKRMMEHCSLHEFKDA
jgi:hypothetical protein